MQPAYMANDLVPRDRGSEESQDKENMTQRDILRQRDIAHTHTYTHSQFKINKRKIK